MQIVGVPIVGWCLLALASGVTGCDGEPSSRAASTAESNTRAVREVALRSSNGDEVGSATIHLGDTATISVRAEGLPDRVRGRRVWLAWLMHTKRRGYPSGYPLPTPAEGALCTARTRISKVPDFALTVAEDARFLALGVRKLNRATRRDVLESRLGRAGHPQPFRGMQIAVGRVNDPSSEPPGPSTCGA